MWEACTKICVLRFYFKRINGALMAISGIIIVTELILQIYRKSFLFLLYLIWRERGEFLIDPGLFNTS